LPLVGLKRILFGAFAAAISLQCQAEIVLQQADDTRLILQQSAKTVITLSPHLTELVFAAGVGDRIIATVEYSEFPDAAADIPRIGDAFRLDLEQILTLKPDLVIAWQSGNPQQAISRLQSLGIDVWTVEIRFPEQIASTLEQIGLATGSMQTARLAANQTRQKLETLSTQYADLAPVSYFYQVASHPLYTINGQHLIAQGLALCGGANIFEDNSTLAPQVAHEFVIAADPQVLLAPAESQQENPLADWLEWQGMQAVSNGAMFLIPADEISRATPRMLDAVATACSLLNGLRNRNNHE